MGAIQMKFVASVGLGLLMSVAAACDPMPMVRLTNQTSERVTIRFEPAKAGDYRLENSFDLKPGGSGHFPAGFTVDYHIVAVAGRCAYVYPLAGEDAIKGDYGAWTNLVLGPDMKLHVQDRRSREQPAGWPLSPIASDCGR